MVFPGSVQRLKALVALNLTTKEERGSSVVECSTLDQVVAGLSLKGDTLLCPGARHFICSTDMTEKLLTRT